MSEENTLLEVDSHYQMWTQDNDKRMTRKHGWNDVTDAYYGKLPSDWPYISKITDPRIRTSLIEKNGRLINARLRGKLVPREGADAIGAIINNTILEQQWDSATHGGSMLTKIGISDMDARMYGSKFAYLPWMYELDEDGKVLFDGNELIPLDIRDCGIDPTASHIRDAKWFQMRRWMHVEDLEATKDAEGNPRYKNLDKLKTYLTSKQYKKSSKRSNAYTSRTKTIQGLEDRVGDDIAFPITPIVTEFRDNRWITFSPDCKEIFEDIPNPFNHRKIPIAQLRYYAVQDEPLGESEVESVLPIWLAIQAVLCAYLDEVILKIRPPLKVIENAARIETIQYGPEAQWLVDRQDAIEEMRSSSDVLNYFQSTYQALISAFNTAMGDLSQGVSSFDTFSKDAKTATEVNKTVEQRNSRDQKNQNDLIEFLKDVMMMWLANNKQFLFTDPSKREHIVRIVGKDQYGKLQQMGLDGVEIMPEALETISSIVEGNPNMTEAETNQLFETAAMPKYPVVLNPNEKDINKIQMKAKMSISETGDIADISVVPEDLDGSYDYVADVQSMSAGANEKLIQARQKAIGLLTTNPVVLQLLQAEGYKPKVKELLTSDLEDSGMRDADRYFEKIETPEGIAQMGGVPQTQQVPGLPGVPQAPAGGVVSQQMAGPVPSQIAG